MSETPGNEPLHSEDLMVTRLIPPRVHASLILRPSLFARLEQSLEKRLTLVSAPTGFGKTTLVSQWLNQRQPEQPFLSAWVTLDEEDNDPLRFWRYVIQGIRQSNEAIGKPALAVLRVARQPNYPGLLTGLVNELAQLPTQVLFILDEVHVLTSAEVIESLLFFIEHLPPNVHVLAMTRSEPDWPVALLRARGELNEIQAGDLRFSAEEIAAFLAAELAATLPVQLIKRIEAKTEGWAAGIRLVSLALQGKTQTAEQVIETFNGEHRFVLDYLRREVFEIQPEETRSFLLHTCLFDRICGSLCDWLTGQSGSGAVLEQLAQANLFVQPLGVSGGQAWYRYQTLFAEAMRHDAFQALGETAVLALYDRASQWYQQQGLLEESVAASLSARQHERAIRLIEQFIDHRTFNDVLILRRWYENLPNNMLRGHPLAAFHVAQALLFSLDRYAPSTVEAVEPLLQSAESDWREQGNLAGASQVLSVRAVMAWWQGDLKQGFALAHQALDRLAESDLLWRGAALLGLAQEALIDGNLTDARSYSMEAQALSGAFQNIHGVLAAINMLAEIDYLQGEMDQAAAEFQQVLADATGGDEMLDDQSIAWLGLARIAYERNDLRMAAEQAGRAYMLSTQRSNELTWVPAGILLAWIDQARGEPVQAQAQLQALLARARQPQMQRLVWITLARLAIVTGDLATARRWNELIVRQASVDFSTEQSQIDLLAARLWIAEGRPEQALPLIRRWNAVFHAQGRIRSEVEAISLEAFCLEAVEHAQKEPQRPVQAVADLSAALAIGQPKGFRRIFLDEGERLARLLQSAVPNLAKRSLSVYATALLHSFPSGQPVRSIRHNRLDDETRSELVEPLSTQETRVLRLIAAGRSNPEIAGELVVSVNTIKTQVQSIYRKLNVNTRDEAREAARELDLI